MARQEDRKLSANFIIKNINPNCAIGSFKKMSRQLFLVANDDVK